MRIGLETKNLLLGGSGGVETYARQLVARLQEADRVNEYTVICSGHNREAFPISAPNFKLAVLGDETIDERAGAGLLKKAVRGANDRLGLAKLSKGFDLVHYFLNIMPGFARFEAASVVTIVDIQHEYFPEFFSSKELALRKKLYELSARNADHIIAISEFTKKTIIEKYGVPEEKITAVHLGYDDAAFRMIKGEAVEAFRKRHGLPEEFLFYPAATWPHKNHVNLLKALSVMKKEYGFKGKLVLTGIKMGGHTELLDMVAGLGLKDLAVYLGYLTYEELPLLYNAATLMVFPSLFEGFGIPVIEAFGSGLPVACSNTTSLPEVAGGAAVLFDPNDPDDIAEKVMGLYDDKKRMAQLSEKGLERAKRFTWKKTAEKTLAVYAKAYGGQRKTDNVARH